MSVIDDIKGGYTQEEEEGQIRYLPSSRKVSLDR